MSLLLPSNRKLRHLEGLSLRNLTLAKPAVRTRTKTIDDDSLPTTHSSPGKLKAKLDGLKLEHSKSSTDLKSQALDGAADMNGNKNHNGTAVRPLKATKRRDTLNWAHETPVSREKMLEDAVAERRLDSFFSLHELGQGNSRPFYISEVKEKFMNPDFKFFDPHDFAPQVSRADGMTVKVFAKFAGSKYYYLLLESDVHTSTLVRVGRTLDNFLQPFPDNCLVFHMSDGVYTSFFELPNLDPFYGKTMFNPAPTPRTATFQPVPTSTLDSLMKLKNLAECIDDALETRDTVCKQIEEHIKEHKKANGTVAAASAAKTRTAAVENAMKQTKREVQKLRAESDSMEAKIEERRDSLRNAILALDEERSKLVTQKEDLRLQVQSQRQTIKAISGQVRRIAQKLLDIFPIEPIEGKPLCFTILEHHLPNAKSFENEIAPNEDATAAALGYVCEIVVILEQQLGIPLPYPITSRGSTSDIFDPLSPSTELGSTVQLPKAQLPNRENSQYRIFPLFQKGSIAKRFNWGVYLLNKNIEELMSKNKLKVMDPRNTLANIKYLLTVLSSGTGDMPHRKVGEIKGLSFRSRVLGEVKDV